MKTQPEICTRSLLLEVTATDERTITFSFSSEYPAERGWGTEILSHAPGAMNLVRAATINFLWNHDLDVVLGKVTKIWQGSDRRGYCTVKWSKTPKAQEYRHKRTQETLKHLSRSTGIPVDQLVNVKDRGRNEDRGTYIHPRLAVRFAIWLSDEFGLIVEDLVQNWMTNGAGNPLWHENRKGLKASNSKLRDAIKAYVDRHSDELSENRKRFIYNNVNDKLAIAIVGCCPAKYAKTRHSNTFRDALNKEQLKNLELLEFVAVGLIEQKDMCPLAAVENAKERIMLVG